MPSLTLASLVSEYLVVGETTGNTLSEPIVTQLAIDAVRKYIAYGDLTYLLPPNDTVLTIADVSQNTQLSASEWGIIKPLFDLYCEYRNALLLESTRAMGLDVYGRSSSEVKQDIQVYEDDLPHKVFTEDIFTMGQDGYDGTDDMVVGAIYTPPLIVVV